MQMSVGTGIASDLVARVARRWRPIDPLLPDPVAPAPGCGAEFLVAGPDGAPAAHGTCDHWHVPPESLDLSWGAAVRFQLQAQIAGPDVAGQLDRMLSLWRDHLAEVPDSGVQDTAAVVTWPSRDVDGVATLVRRGFTPMAVIAARPADRAWAEDQGVDRRSAGDQGADRARAGDHAGPGWLRIRRAGPEDLDTVVRLALEVIRYDAHFGGVTERPSTPAALRRELAGLLGADAWTWLAEREGVPVGMLIAEPPSAAAWIAPMVSRDPIAYLLLMYVAPPERGTGVGTALTRQLHRAVREAGIAVTLLHYAQVNPLSVPFWSQRGYRPLWTVWETAPASAIR
jgi:GNAT superfamily N-acetyltransferase